MRENIAPVIIVLNEIALSKALPVKATESVQIGSSRNPDRRYCEVARLVLNALNTVLGENGFI
jgi:hypothetical protein